VSFHWKLPSPTLALSLNIILSPFGLSGSILPFPLLSLGESPHQAQNAFITIVTACCIIPRSSGPHNLKQLWFDEGYLSMMIE